jgi:hypothetical protein
MSILKNFGIMERALITKENISCYSVKLLNFLYITATCMGKDMEKRSNKKILLVGDRVMIAPEKDQERTSHGLYLPPGVKEKEKVQSGYKSWSGIPGRKSEFYRSGTMVDSPERTGQIYPVAG